MAKAFGRALKTTRVDVEMTRLELATAIGLQRPDDIGRLERGERVPDLGTLLALGSALGVGAQRLLASTEEKLRTSVTDAMEEERGR